MAAGTGYDIGTAFVQVVLSLQGISRDAAKAGAEAGKSFRTSFDEETGKGSVPLPSPSKPESTKRGAESGGAFVDGFRKQLQAAQKSLPELKVGVATTEAEQKLKDLSAEIAGLRDARIGVDLDESAALAKLADIRAQLERLGADSASVQVRTDTAAASAALAVIEEQVNRLDGRNATVDVNVDDHGSIGRVSSGLSGLAVAGLALGPALLPIGAVGIAAFAGIATGALAAAAGAGVAALGISSVSDATKGLTKADKARASGAEAVQAAAGRETSAEASLSNARASAADAAVRSSEAIVKARQGVTQAEQDGVRQVQAAEQQHAQAIRAVQDAVGQLEQAEQSLTRAQRDRTDAQKALTAATEDARRKLRDLQLQTEDGALAERDAVLGIAEAQKNLAAVKANPKADALQRQRAQLSYDEAVQNLKDLRVRNSDLAAEKAAADKAGVKGSAQVTAAQRGIADAADRVSAAQGGVQKATQGVADARAAEQKAAAGIAQAQVAASQKVAEANGRLTDAIRSQTGQQRQSAFSVAQAQAQVTKAQEATTKAAKDSAAAQAKALAGIPPAAIAFARFLQSIQGQFTALKQAAAGPVLGGLEAGIRGLLPALPVLRDVIGQVGVAVGGLFASAGKALGSAQGQAFLRFFGGAAAQGISVFGRLAGSVLSGLASLARAFIPLGLQVGEAVAGWTKSFATVGQSNGVTKFLDFVQKVGPGAAAALGSIVKAVGHLLAAFAPLGVVALGLIKDFADLINAIPTPVLTGLLAVVIPLAIAVSLLSTAAGIATAVTGAWATAVGILNAVMALNPFVLVAIALVALGAAFVLAYQHSDTFRTVVIAAFNGVKAAISSAWNGVIKPVLSALATFFNVVLGPAITFWWQHIVQPYFNLAKAVVTVFAKVALNVLQNFAIFFRNVLFPVLQAFYTAFVKPVFEGAGKVISATWNNVIKPVLQALGTFISTKVAPAFAAGVSAIGAAWNKLKDVVTAPINFVIGTVLNNGIIRAYNFLVSKFGGKPLEPLALIGGGDSGAKKPSSPSSRGSAFAAGGVLPGYTPGRDVHDFYSPTAGRLALSGGEAIMRPEWTRAMGAGWVDRANRAARNGGVSGVQRFVGGYAGGGIIGKLKSAVDWGKAGISTLSAAAKLGLRAAVEFILAPVRAAFDQIPGGFSQDVLRGMGNSLIGSLLGKADAQQQVGDPTGAGTSSGPGSVDTGRFPAIKAFLRTVDPLPYIWGGAGPGGYDCSGIASAVYGMLTGRGGGHGQRYFTTSSSFGALGFRPGTGAFTVGVNPGTHMDGRIDGLGFEAQSTATGIFVGNGATPTGRFRQQFYLPAAEPAKGSAVRATVQKLDTGGYLAPGWNAVLNATGRPERVLNPAQERALMAGAGSGSRGHQITNNVANYGQPITAADVTRAQRQAEALLPIG